MNKEQYISQLKGRMEAAGITNVDERIEFYDEMLSDRIDSGMEEEAAVSSMEDIEDIIENARLEKPVTALVAEKVIKSHEEAKKKGNGALWIILAIIGFPIWLPILCVLFSLLLVIYIVLWTIVFTIFVVLLSFAIAAVASLAAFITMFFNPIPSPIGFAGLGGALFFGGLTVLLFKPCVVLAKSIATMIPAIFKKIKKNVA